MMHLALGQVLGKEHSGRVRGLGTGPCPSKVFHLPTYCFHNSSFGIGETSNNAYMRSESASMQQKLEILEAERAREQVERARTDGILKYLSPDVSSTKASPRENRPSSGASHDSVTTMHIHLVLKTYN